MATDADGPRRQAIIAPLSAAQPSDVDLAVWLQDLRLTSRQAAAAILLAELLGPTSRRVVRKLRGLAREQATPEAPPPRA